MEIISMLILETLKNSEILLKRKGKKRVTFNLFFQESSP